MASKAELQTALKDNYGINKNISQPLSKEECERLLYLLNHEPSAAKLAESFAQKNSDLGQNNAYYGRLRGQAEKKLETLQADYGELEQAIQALELSKLTLEARKQQLEQEGQALEAELRDLSTQNTNLATQVNTLTTRGEELLEANMQLKQDNKELKNLVDQIRLRLARDTKMLLQYEDSQIRKAVIRLFRWTLG